MACIPVVVHPANLLTSHHRCGHCKKLAPIWTQLAAQMQHKLTIAEVNCEAYEGLCRGEGVPGFPQLIYYGGKGQGKVEYTSGRKLEQLRAFAEKVSGPCVTMPFCASSSLSFPIIAGPYKNYTMRTSMPASRNCRSCISCCIRTPILLSSYVLLLCACDGGSSMHRTMSWRPLRSCSVRRRYSHRHLPSFSSTSTSHPALQLYSR